MIGRFIRHTGCKSLVCFFLLIFGRGYDFHYLLFFNNIRHRICILISIINMEVVIGMQQTYGSNFAMEIEGCVDEYNVTAFGDEDYRTVVITEGSQIGVVDYGEDE